MCPGLTHPNAVMEADVPKGTVVAVYAEGMEHALAVGLAVMSTQEMCVFLFHYLYRCL